MTERWQRRDAKLRKRRDADMVVSNRGLRSVIGPLIGRKATDPCPHRNVITEQQTGHRYCYRCGTALPED